MYLAHIDSLTPGERLGKALYDDQGRLLVTAGYTVNESLIARLRSLGYSFVYADNPVVTKIKDNEIISAPTRQQLIKQLQQIVQVFVGNAVIESLEPRRIRKEVYSNRSLRNALRLKIIRRSAGQILDDLADNKAGYYTHNPMRPAATEPFEHAVDTAVLSLLLGQKLGLEWDDLLSLGTAALLHDIGKLILQPAFAKKRDIPEEKKLAALREHPIFGMLMVKSSDPAGFKEQITIEEHHERLDGSGYPRRIRGGDTHPAERPIRGRRVIYRYARILAVADYYDNLVNGRDEHPLLPPDMALATMIKRSGILWNAHVIRALVETVQPYPAAMPVVVRRSENDKLMGTEGIVLKPDPADPLRPTVVFLKDKTGKDIKPVKVNLNSDRLIRLQAAV